MPSPVRWKTHEEAATRAAHEVGHLLRRHLNDPDKVIHEATRHDIKLELDVRSQQKIERILQRAFPSIPILGEEGNSGDPSQVDLRWVVDPIDGTVNFTHGMPHACISIALQRRLEVAPTSALEFPDEAYETVLGVVLDPFTQELWTARRGGKARLNGKVIQVSPRNRLSEAILAMGFAKKKETMARMLPVFTTLAPKVRKVRILGAAALSMTWVASGRLDLYREFGLRLWDIAAAGLIIECAGGEFHRVPISADHRYEIVASNGLLRRPYERAVAHLFKD